MTVVPAMADDGGPSDFISHLAGSAAGRGGRTVRGEVEGTDGYGMTAIIAVEAARRLVADGAKSGVLAPSQAFDPESFLGFLSGHGVRWRLAGA